MASNIWEQVKGLFQSAERSSSDKPVIHEVIKRSAKEQKQSLDFRKSLAAHRFFDWLGDQYAVFRVNPHKTDRSLDFLNTVSTKGFVIYLEDTNYALSESASLMDEMKERMVTAGYRQQLADRKVYNKNSWVETVERYYLKPPLSKMEDGLYDQSYGNITLDLVIRNNKPHHLKLRVVTYNDRKYHAPRPFNELMDVILMP